MSASDPEPRKLAGAQITTELYRSCMTLSEEARSLLVENEGMKRLGLNAQVLAAQTGEQGGALEVIVSEIGRLSQAIRDVLGELGDAAKVLSNSSIEILHLSHLHASYADGWRVGIDPMAMREYESTLSQVKNRGKKHLADLEQRLRAISSLVDDLSRIAQQIPPVTTMIRIVITEVKIRSVELLGTVDDLKTFHALLDAKVERMEHIRNGSCKYIQEMRKGELG